MQKWVWRNFYFLRFTINARRMKCHEHTLFKCHAGRIKCHQIILLCKFQSYPLVESKGWSLDEDRLSGVNLSRSCSYHVLYQRETSGEGGQWLTGAWLLDTSQFLSRASDDPWTNYRLSINWTHLDLTTIACVSLSSTISLWTNQTGSWEQRDNILTCWRTKKMEQLRQWIMCDVIMWIMF